MTGPGAADPARWAERLRGAPILVTGAAGFIGYHLSERLIAEGLDVVGFDNLSPYYDVALKRARLERLARHGARFRMVEGDLADAAALERAFVEAAPRHVAHLAAQAGVRHSLREPEAYAQANLVGALNVLERCRHGGVAHLAYASTSSVYGGDRRLPFRVEAGVDHPVSLYAATKKANELMAHCYSHLYDLPATGLRFFTVYGPWGRPDMAYFIFTKAIIEGAPIRLFNHGRMHRDFTYVDDIVEGVARVLATPAEPDPDFDRAAPNPATSWAPHRVFNIGNTRKEALGDFVAILEDLIGERAVVEMAEMQPGDVEATWADVSALERAVGFRPNTSLRDGLTRFVEWYRAHYGV
ncbi:MAG: NAD-dependent epimerase [Pseudomonadota bacterium]